MSLLYCTNWRLLYEWLNKRLLSVSVILVGKHQFARFSIHSAQGQPVQLAEALPHTTVQWPSPTRPALPRKPWPAVRWRLGRRHADLGRAMQLSECSEFLNCKAAPWLDILRQPNVAAWNTLRCQLTKGQLRLTSEPLLAARHRSSTVSNSGQEVRTDAFSLCNFGKASSCSASSWAKREKDRGGDFCDLRSDLLASVRKIAQLLFVNWDLYSAQKANFLDPACSEVLS